MPELQAFLVSSAKFYDKHLWCYEISSILFLWLVLIVHHSEYASPFYLSVVICITMAVEDLVSK